MNNSFRRDGWVHVFDARLKLACAELEGTTERELENRRYEYKIERDKAIKLGVDIQQAQLPRTIKKKYLQYILK
ncbi:hypothetical protein M0R72_05550 [Candidatus Pacearchaeota archaeon]|jgi:hypothetical protein|nr:hypothetical protein [Candidatus Pacearchaeota archaeon]